MSGQGHQGKRRKKEACSKDWEVEGRVCPHAQIAITDTLIQGEKWQLQIMKERRHSHHRNGMRVAKSKTSKKEVFGTNKDKGKFKAPPPMTTPAEKRNHAKFCEFHSEVGHNMDECIHLRKQIVEMLKAGKLSHLVKEIKQNNKKEQPKETKKGETSRKDKALAILMENEGTEGPMIIEAEIRGHYVHCIMAPKKTSTSAALAMKQAAIRQIINDRVAAALEA
uniref:Reverse transcriptase domain-containing protein n=1 Tax=Tanacetum cinerariifolium TaxID=118510 RepID=A0A6L2K3Z1_TANCI|nr:hypothetical protein [Tanacetum cinerariifolium]